METQLISSFMEHHGDRPRAKQPYDAFLVLDVEGTCEDGSKAFDYPNEIIEWPVCLLRWKDKDEGGLAECLEVVSEFRSFVKPTWKPRLSEFCKKLTGEQIDCAPTFTELLDSIRKFLAENGLIDPVTGRHLVRFCWCSDGPHDIRDFVVKQCFISKVAMPAWITGDVLDIRKAVHILLDAAPDKRSNSSEQTGRHHAFKFSMPRRMALTIPRQLAALGLSSFQGRQHSGIDDARNIARILAELPKRGVKLEPNTSINPRRRWPWMGKRGKILEDYI
ncbi:hypothetical protein FOMPIDRAFT_1026780 [Fomitopsis schrenkii]|uniref:Exonuclease domain-containing protein n=1 Tax=Fomitopsis schrenkii TaxID=2126942 RepID=S8FXP1_FOMSC|nr:hypothetical protein FOMPIDRAFT_1026780 [Fomitopsis schrenkii]